MTLLLLLMTQGGTMTLEEADRLFAQRRYEEALEAYRKVSEVTSDNRAKVEALSQVARCHTIAKRLDDARAWLDRAGKVASKDEPYGWSRYVRSRGLIERESGDKRKAQATFEELFAFCADKGLHQRAVDAIHHIAIVAPKEEQPAWALKGIAEAEKAPDDGMLAILWNNLGGTYEDLKQFDKSLDAYLKAREYHGKGGDDHRKLVADWAVGRAFRMAGRHKESRELLEKTLAWAEKRHAAKPEAETLEYYGWCKKDLGQTLVALGEKDRGLGLMREGRAHLIEAKIEEWWPDGLKDLDEVIRKTEGAK